MCYGKERCRVNRNSTFIGWSKMIKDITLQEHESIAANLLLVNSSVIKLFTVALLLLQINHASFFDYVK